jgi:hypothetical protein
VQSAGARRRVNYGIGAVVDGSSAEVYRDGSNVDRRPSASAARAKKKRKCPILVSEAPIVEN